MNLWERDPVKDQHRDPYEHNVAKRTGFLLPAAQAAYTSLPSWRIVR